jgi:3-deoxy-D-manno-octulosonic-acid transferase/heptosyltransferase-1
MTICQRKSGGRILCIRLSGLGDVVHALNALTLLRRERPSAHITWLVEDRFGDLLRGHPYIDELVTAPRLAWGYMLKDPLSWPALGKQLRELGAWLRAAHFDVSVDFQSSLKSAPAVLAAGAELRVGFGRHVNRELNALAQNCTVQVPARGMHRIERNLALLAPLGIATRYAEPVLPVRRHHRAAAERALEELRGEGPLVVVHPGTSEFAAFKRWDPSRYAAVADRLIARRGADVLVTYGPDDRALAEQVVAHMEQPGVLAPPTDSIQQLTHLLSRADLFLGSDTGPMHIASALGVPLVALFGPKDPVQTGPYCSRSLVVTGRADCRPCNRRRCSHVRCMTSISARNVLGAALEVLDGGGRRRARQGPLKRPCTTGFRLGQWRGRVATCYSAPEFYRRLADPDGLVSGPAAKVLSESSSRTTASVPGQMEGLPERLVAKLYTPKRSLYRRLGDLMSRPRARNSWRAALRLERDGVPTPFGVCYLEKGAGWGKEQLLMTEELPESMTLAEWLVREDGANWRRAPRARKDALIEAVAGLVRTLHGAGYFHSDLRAANLLVRPVGQGWRPELCVIDVDRTRWVGWAPPMLRDVFFGLDLRRFALTLKAPVGPRDAALFFRAYCRGFIREPHRQRLLKRIITRYPRRHAEKRGRGFWVAWGTGRRR